MLPDFWHRLFAVYLVSNGAAVGSWLQVRFVCIMCLGIIHVLFTVLLMQSPNRMAFRVGGALDSVQKQYLLLNRCFSMVTFDLQAQVCQQYAVLQRQTLAMP